MSLIRFQEYDGAFSVDEMEFYKRMSSSEEDIVAICGTLVSGIGNKYSDFDVHVFCRERPKLTAAHFDNHDWVSSGDGIWVSPGEIPENSKLRGTWDFWDELDRSIDIKYWEMNEIKETCSDFHQRYVDSTKDLGFMKHSDFSTYGIGDSTLFAKLFEALVVLNADKFDDIISPFSKEQYCYLAYRYHTPVYDDFRDILGAYKSGDMDTTISFLRQYCENVAWSFSHLLMSPNTNRKWVSALVSRWPAPYLELSKIYQQSLNSNLKNLDEKKEYIRRMLNWSDDIFSKSIDILETIDTFVSPREIDDFWRSNLIERAGKKITSEQSKQEYIWYSRLGRKDAVRLSTFLEIEYDESK